MLGNHSRSTTAKERSAYWLRSSVIVPLVCVAIDLWLVVRGRGGAGAAGSCRAFSSSELSMIITGFLLPATCTHNTQRTKNRCFACTHSMCAAVAVCARDHAALMP